MEKKTEISPVWFTRENGEERKLGGKQEWGPQKNFSLLNRRENRKEIPFFPLYPLPFGYCSAIQSHQNPNKINSFLSSFHTEKSSFSPLKRYPEYMITENESVLE